MQEIRTFVKIWRIIPVPKIFFFHIETGFSGFGARSAKGTRSGSRTS